MIFIKIIGVLGLLLFCLGYIIGMINVFILDKDDNRPLKMLVGGAILMAFAFLFQLFFYVYLCSVSYPKLCPT